MAHHIHDWLDDLVSLDGDTTIADTSSASRSQPAGTTPPSTPSRKTCTFEVLICGHFTCDSLARDIVKTSDCGCSAQPLRAPACVARWCAAQDARAAIVSSSGIENQKSSLRKSSGRLWGRLGSDDRRFHFCDEHAQPSALLEAMRRREVQPRAYGLWSGPFPGEYPAGPTRSTTWVEMWDAMVRDREVDPNDADRARCVSE